jgi:hypothetical protein
MPLQIRRGTDAERLAMIQPLAAGELVYITDSQRLYIGNGSALGGVQITGYTNEDAVDAVGAALVAGTHTGGISFTYGATQDNANRIDATVSINQLTQNLNLNTNSITGTGNINIAGNVTITGRFTGDYKGSIFGDDSTTLVDAVGSSINLDGTVKGNVIPDSDTARSIGSISKRFNTLYLSNGITIGTRSISIVNGNVDLPTGTTIGGELLGAATLQGTNLNVNIVADDSTTIVNSSTASFRGLLYGSVAADDSTLLLNHQDRTFSGGLGANLTLNTYNITGNGNIAISGSGSFTSTLTSNTSVTAPIVNVSNTLNVDNIADLTTFGVTVTSEGSTPLTVKGIGTLGPTSGQVYFNVSASKGTPSAPTTTSAGDYLGGITIQGYDGTDYKAASLIVAAWDSTAILSDTFPNSTLRFISGGGGSLLRQASFDNQGVFAAPIFKAGSYTTTEMNNITSPTAGMIIFNTTTNDFMGHNGSAWVAFTGP